MPSFSGADDYLSFPPLTTAGWPCRHFLIGAVDERIASGHAQSRTAHDERSNARECRNPSWFAIASSEPSVSPQCWLTGSS